MSAVNPFLCPAKERGWKVEAAVRGAAGTIVLASLALSLLDRRWLWLTAFVGANLLQSSLTGWCLMSNFLAVLGIGGTKRNA
ncbi:MAG: YgaP family membrane protein [Vulcanimicrobiaceae bacterium]